MRVFVDIEERTVIEVLHMFLEMYEEREKETQEGKENIPLTHNLEVLENSIKGKINIHQTNFNLYGYTVVCATNKEKNQKSRQRLESYLFSGSTLGEELIAHLKSGGVSEDTVSWQQHNVKPKDDFTGGEWEKELTKKTLLGYQRKLLGKGFFLGRLLKSAVEGQEYARTFLNQLSKENKDFKEALEDAIMVWEMEELVENLIKEF